MTKHVHISLGNTQLGYARGENAIHNVSLLPGVTCPKLPCNRRRACYAVKFLARPSVLKAWRENTTLATHDPDRYWTELHAHLLHYQPGWFRFHVAGDFPDQAYVYRAFALARQHPNVRFLAFTKRYGFGYKGKPDNFSLVFSAWPGVPLPRTKRPIAWMDDGTDPRIPKDAIECPGNCSECGVCWSLARRGLDVVFHKH